MAIDLRKPDNGGGDVSSESELRPVRTVYPENYGAPEIYPTKRTFKVFPEKNGTEISPVPEKDVSSISAKVFPEKNGTEITPVPKKDVNSISARYVDYGNVPEKPKKNINRKSALKIVGIPVILIGLIIISATAKSADDRENSYVYDTYPEAEILLTEAPERSDQYDDIFPSGETEKISVINGDANVYFVLSDTADSIYIAAEASSSADYAADLKDGTVSVSMENGTADDVVTIYIPENYGGMIEFRDIKKCRGDIFCEAGKNFQIVKSGEGGVYFSGVDAEKAYVISMDSFVHIDGASFTGLKVESREALIYGCTVNGDANIEAGDTVSLSNFSVSGTASLDGFCYGIEGENIRLGGTSSLSSMWGDIHLVSADFCDADVYVKSGNIYISAVKDISEYKITTDILYGDCNVSDTEDGQYTLKISTESGNVIIEN